MPDALIEARGVERAFDDGAVAALRGVTFQIEAGEFVAIAGPSGSGKSTLLHIIGALDEPTAGEMRFAGRDMRTMPDRPAFRAHTIGFVFQAFHLLPTLTAVENVQVPMFEMSWPRAERRRRAEDLLALVGLSHRMDHRPAKLSGGERQRVAIARSLANDPAVLLADEPTGNLDSGSATIVADLLRTIHEQRGVTVVLVTHDPIVAAIGQRTLKLVDGRIVDDQRVATGTPGIQPPEPHP
jgi:putative ABC transport system ATP-binding protein